MIQSCCPSPRFIARVSPCRHPFRGVVLMSTEPEKVRSINAMLAQWQGEQAQIWSYTASLATLEIRLFSALHEGDLRLVCSPCVSIMAPAYWERCNLSVTVDP